MIKTRKQAENALGESEERYRDLFENAEELIQSVSSDGRFISVNRAWRRTLGDTEEELNELSAWDIIHPEYKSHSEKIFKSLYTGESVSNFETIFVSKDGKQIPVEGNANCLFEGNKSVLTRGIFRNISERTRAEEERKELEAKLM